MTNISVLRDDVYNCVMTKGPFFHFSYLLHKAYHFI